jgi:hypothetical protein
MLDEFERYAVYWAPGPLDSLARFGCSWMGWCAETGEPRSRHVTDGFSIGVAALTRQVARHGFHGVIKAPFRLNAGRSRWSVEHELQALADDLIAFPLPKLELAVLDGQVSLAPARPNTRLGVAVAKVQAALRPMAVNEAGDAVDTANADGGELMQLPAGDAHRFHLPLTDRLDLGTAFQLLAELRPRLAPMLDTPRQLGDLALMGDPGGDRPLRILHRFELSNTAAPNWSSSLTCLGPQTLVQMPGTLHEPKLAV